ncbi:MULTISPECIES: hypothetical protein [unclassified Endozoicomonas]|uniref:hypothetical protein n=1 Tax=unclassified Endozoicomonas TaxID=2644528 RepID=UPI003BB7E870
MTNVRPNALRLAVAVAISSSIITAQAMAERRLQTRSVGIYAKIPVEFTQREVIVQPTVGDDRQPIPKSFTTIYPYQTQTVTGYHFPYECFTDVLPGIDGGVSSVDQFETGKNDAARKYTKVLKVGDEGVFRFIHNLAEKKLVIEVRNGMTDQGSIEAVRTQSGDIQPLDPLTKIASPEQLAAVLKGAHGRAGKLGEVDDYVALATVEVDRVEVNGRTFMRLVAVGDQPPGLQRLGQTLFINDEALLAAASSAYTQVHVLGKELQQEALNDLLSFHKPVGYVIHVEDDTQAYAVPENCPKLEVTEAQGEVIVFHGQKQNPADVAFVELLYDIWLQWYDCNCPPSEAITRVKKDKVKSYEKIIRSKQMALLERIAEQHNPEPAKGGKTTLAINKQLSMLSYKQQLTTLLYYEYLQQALIVAMQDRADEFDLSIGQIRVASSAFTPALMFNQLEKNFNFKPAIENLLNNQRFIQDIHDLMPACNRINQELGDTPETKKKLVFKVGSETTRQIIETENNQKILLLKEYGLTHLRRQVLFKIEKTTTSEKEHLRIAQLKKRIDEELMQLRYEQQQQNNLLQKLQPEVERFPEQKQQMRFDLTTARNAQMAAELGIDDWDDIQPFREQDRLIKKKVLKINQLVAALFTVTGQSDEEAVKAKAVATEGECSIVSIDENGLGYLQFIRQLLQQDIQVTNEKVPKRLAVFEVKPDEEAVKAKTPATEGKRDIASVNKGDLRILQSFKQYLQQKKELTDRIIHKKLAHIEVQLGLVPDIEKAPEIRCQAIHQHIRLQGLQMAKEMTERRNWLKSLQEQTDRIPPMKRVISVAVEEISQDYINQMAAKLGINNRDGTQPPEKQARLSHQNIHEISQPVTPASIAPTSIAPTPVVATPVTPTPVAAHSGMQDFDAQTDSFSHARKDTQLYDDEILDMNSAAIHYVEHEPEDLKSFMEYFSARSASGNKIITLLHEGLISKVELENYMKAARDVGGYEIEQEFEHFLGHKHDMGVAEFKSVIQMLSEKGIEEFIQTALTPVTATAPAGMKESVTGTKEYAAAVIANYILDDIAFDNGRRTAAFLTHLQDTLTPHANAAGISESELIQTIHGTLMQAHAAAVEQQLNDYWLKPSAFLLQAVTWYYSSYKPLLVTHPASQATTQSLANMSFLYLLDLTNRGDYLHRMLTPFQHWLERYGVDLDRTGQYACHGRIEKISEVGGLAMPLGKAAASVILLKTGSMLFARQHNANPHRYRSISRLVPEIVKSMGSGQGVQIPLLHRATPQKVKTLASATAGLVLGPVATVGAYVHGLVSGFTFAQTFGLTLASSLTFDFFMNDNKMLSQWLGGPLGRSLDKMNRWTGLGETQDEYVQRTAIASPQHFNETDAAYTNRVKASNRMHGWTRYENYLQFRERRDRTMKLFADGWEKYFRENVPKWSFSHSESIPYSYTLGAFFEPKAALTDHKVEKFDHDKNTRDEL